MNNLRNKVQLIGNLGADPEIKPFDKDKSLAKLSIATNEKFRNAAGELVENTQWHRITAFGPQAEFAKSYLTKGSEVAIEGRLVYNSYEDKQGIKRYTTDIIITEILLLGSKPKSAA